LFPKRDCTLKLGIGFSTSHIYFNKELFMKKSYLFLVAGIISFSLSSFAETTFGLKSVVYGQSSAPLCVDENPKKPIEIWAVSCGMITCFDRNKGYDTLVKDISPVTTNRACAFDTMGYFWIGSKGKVLRLNTKNLTVATYAAAQAGALAGITRDIKYDALHNRVVFSNDSGTCIANLSSSGEINNWQNFPEIGRSKGIGIARIFFWENEVWVAAGFIYRYNGSSWSNYDTADWKSGLANGSAMDRQGNFYVGNGTVVKWDRSTGEWSHLGITGNKSSPFIMNIDRNGIVLFEGADYYCKVDLNDPTLTVENFSRLELSWEYSDPSVSFCPIQLTSAGNFLILGQAGWVEMKDASNSVRPFVLTPKIRSEKLTFVGLVDPLGRLVVKTNSYKPVSAAGNYFALYRTKSGKSIVKKVPTLK
jgi:streptogramin lyase